MEKTPAIIVDIDGTIADFKHRRHLLNQENDDNSEFYARMIHDEPMGPIIEIVNSFVEIDEYQIIFLTSRPEIYRQITECWLFENIIFPTIDGSFMLYMRQPNDPKNNAKFKRLVYFRSIEDHFDTLFVIDDRDECVKMWREIGLTCLQPGNGNY